MTTSLPHLPVPLNNFNNSFNYISNKNLDNSNGTCHIHKKTTRFFLSPSRQVPANPLHCWKLHLAGIITFWITIMACLRTDSGESNPQSYSFWSSQFRYHVWEGETELTVSISLRLSHIIMSFSCGHLLVIHCVAASLNLKKNTCSCHPKKM